MLAATATTMSRVREHKEIPSNSSNIDRQYHYKEHQHLTTQSNKLSQQQLSQQQKQSTKSSRLLSSSVSTSVEQPPPAPPPPLGSSSGSMCSSMNMNRRNKLSQQHTRFTSHVNPMSPTTASSVSDVVASNPSAMPPPLPMQDKTDIFHLHYIDQAHSSTSSTINSSVSNTNSSATNAQHMNSQQQQQLKQHYKMPIGRHKEHMIGADKLDYATSSFTEVKDVSCSIRDNVIVEEDEEDILSSDNTFMHKN